MPADLDLDTDAGDATLPSQETFNLNASQLGAHTVTESAVAGLGADGAGVHGRRRRLVDEPGDRAATLDIDAGETVVCTFTNTKHASLKVVKVTDPASDPQDFDFDLTGSGVPADLDLDTDARRRDAAVAGDVQPERGAARRAHGDRVRGRRLGADGAGVHGRRAATRRRTWRTRTATLDIDAGETVVCTFTNTKSASLTVVKVTDPASDPQDFDFDLTGSGVPADLDLDTDAGDATLPSQETFSLNAAQLGAQR